MANYQDAASWLFERARRPDENMRQLLEMLMMSKQLEEQRGQQKWERGIKEREVSAEEMWRKAQLAGAMQEPQLSALEEKFRMLSPFYSPQQATELATLGREPKEEKSEIPAQEKEYRTRKTEVERYYAREISRIKEEKRKQAADLKLDPLFQGQENKAQILMQFEKQYKGVLSELETSKEKEFSDLEEEFSFLPQFKGRKKKTPVTQKPIVPVQKADNFGFIIGEERQALDGHIYKYVGNNKWQLHK